MKDGYIYAVLAICGLLALPIAVVDARSNPTSNTERSDGDGKADIAIWRPSTGAWYIINSSNGSVTVVGWGISSDIAVPADYDGDVKTDIAVWRPSTAQWFIIKSSDGSISVQLFGTAEIYRCHPRSLDDASSAS